MTTFNFEQALNDLRAGKDLNGKNGILTPLIKQLTEAALKAELEDHLASEVQSNRKNGSSQKTIKTAAGSFELDTPRDRANTFSPQIIKKNQTSLTNEIERKVLSMFSLGLSYRDIRSHIEDIYGLDLSSASISTITDKLIPELEEWRERPLQSIYPIVWLDAIHYKVKIEGQYISQAFYTILGLTIEGKKEILGLYLSESEGASNWLSVLTDLQNRGVKDILIACIDGLSGFPEAIATIYPNTEVQLCIVHQIRNSLKYVASKNQKEFMADLKSVYRATSLNAAESALDRLEAKWGGTYPLVIKSWRTKWHNLSAYFKYPEAIRRVIYTTNSVEAVHRQFRKLTKTKGAFPNANSLLKLLYVGILNATEKWSMPIQNWSQAISQLDIYFDGRLDQFLDI
jgi:transposase-like protein